MSSDGSLFNKYGTPITHAEWQRLRLVPTYCNVDHTTIGNYLVQTQWRGYSNSRFQTVVIRVGYTEQLGTLGNHLQYTQISESIPHARAVHTLVCDTIVEDMVYPEPEEQVPDNVIVGTFAMAPEENDDEYIGPIDDQSEDAPPFTSEELETLAEYVASTMPLTGVITYHTAESSLSRSYGDFVDNSNTARLVTPEQNHPFFYMERKEVVPVTCAPEFHFQDRS